MWPDADRWRAPVGDFPPPWASAWGDDEYGLWADLSVNGVAQRMRWIEPTDEGGFLMGSTQAERDQIKDDDWRKWANGHEFEPQPVIVPRGFWLANTSCTQAFWAAVRDGDAPSHFKDQPNSAERPVDMVNFDDVSGFLSALRILQPDARPALPSEVQWEYACRAGTHTAYWWGDAPDTQRFNMDRTLRETTPVHAYAPNPFGLHDMHGNVWEWCADAWRERLDRPQVEPDELGAAEGGALRAVRGGSWIDEPGGARSAYRGRWRAGSRLDSQGFRLLLRSPSPAREAGGR